MRDDSPIPRSYSISDEDDDTLTFSWQPALEQVGVYPNVHFEVSDGEATIAKT